MDDLKIVADPTRRRILQMVWTDGVAAGDIADQFDMTFGAVSQHLRLLREAGFVTVRRDGNRRIYRAEPDGLGPLRPLIEAMWADRLGSLAQLAEDSE